MYYLRVIIASALFPGPATTLFRRRPKELLFDQRRAMVTGGLVCPETLMTTGTAPPKVVPGGTTALT
jgi:hypothetical protein